MPLVPLPAYSHLLTVVISRSITAQARAEEAILNLSKEREAMAKAEATESEERRKVAVEEKRQQELLIDVTSHEIRNPVRCVAVPFPRSG